MVDLFDLVDWFFWWKYILDNVLRYFKVLDDKYKVGFIIYSDDVNIVVLFNVRELWDVVLNRVFK